MDQVAQIREKIDIVSLISEYISVKKAGRNFKANCPFHSEKTPSFVISPERQIWHCFGCFPPGEKIKTPFGYHNIEEIDTNHWVVSGKGNLRKVTDVMEHQYQGDLIQVKIRKLGGEVKLTSDHNVFVIRPALYMQKQYKNFSRRYRKYLKIRESNFKKYQRLIDKYFPIQKIPAGELQNGDLLLYPINRNITDVQVLDLSSYVTKFTNKGSSPKDIPMQIPVDKDFLKILGYWIAEGSSHRAYIRFSLGNHEEDFAQEIVQYIKKIFGLKAKIHRRLSSKKTGLEISVCHSTLANIFQNLCGKGASNKHIPFVFQELPLEKQRVLLEAIYKGDGTTFQANKSKNWHKSITTISRVLSEQIVDVLIRLNLFPSLFVQKARIDKRLLSHKEAYVIFWSEEIQQKYNLVYYHADGTDYWILPIIKLNKINYKGPVYNFTVDQDNSYVATNFAVANCQKGGDAFTFIMEYEHIEFSESLRFLAKKAGITLIHKGFDNQTSSKKDLVYTLNYLSAEFYHYILTKHNAGKKALEYLLENRKINKKLIETFKLGYAPTVGNILSTYLTRKKGYKKEDLFDAGLSTFRSGRVVDFFMNRIMFPLSDHRENILGFSGRTMNDTTLPKYINTKDTLVYQKGSNFFGFNIAKEEIRKQNHAILVEGEFDVLSCFQEGFSNTIAIKGTALTDSQVALISRFAQKVSLCFDMDKAGQEALKRSLPILEKHNIVVSVIALQNGKDPDESIRNDPYVFKKAVKEDLHVYDYLLIKALVDFDKDSADGKKAIADLLLPFFSQISNEIVKEHYLRKLSVELDTSFESVVKEADKRIKKTLAPIEQISVLKDKRGRIEILEQYLVSLIIQSEAARSLVGQTVTILEDSISKERAYQKILYQLLSYFENSKVFDTAAFASYLPDELASAHDACYLFPLPRFENSEKYTKEVLKTAHELKQLYLKARIKRLSETMKQKEKEQESTEMLVNELKQLVSKLSS